MVGRASASARGIRALKQRSGRARGFRSALGAVAGRGLRPACPALALGLRRAGLPHKLAGNDCQLVEGAGGWCGVGGAVAGREVS